MATFPSGHQVSSYYFTPVRYQHCHWYYSPPVPFNHTLIHLITKSKNLGATFPFMPKCHPCLLWVDYPFRIRHAAAGTDTTLFKHVSALFIFSTLHIYFVPFHCRNGQRCTFQLTTSQKSLFNFPISQI